jgi:single-strand DNA-binding protein
MSGLNKVMLLGRLGKDPELKSLEGGNKVCTFSMATSEVWKDKTTGEKKEKTEWHNIVVWGSPAETIAKYVHKGDQLYVEGKQRTRSWEKDNITRYSTETHVETFMLLGGKSNSSAQAPAPTPTEKPGNADNEKPKADDTDDLPF